MTARLQAGAAVLCLVVVAGCAEETTTPVPSPTTTETVPTPQAIPSPTYPATLAPSPTPSPEPELALELPDERDPRVVEYGVAVEVPAGESGRIVVTITNRSDTRIDEIVARWPTALGERLFLAPSAGTTDVPLVVPWTKWVEGPGEHGEPAGTTSLGWGPLDAGATLDITMAASRRDEGDAPLSFDLQILAGEALLTGIDGDPSTTRVEVP
jgi:hypothetical protein